VAGNLWGDRIAIDRAAGEMMARSALCYVMALNVGIKGLRGGFGRRDRDTTTASPHRPLKEERDRAFDEARESRQIPAPIKVELTLPDADGRVPGTRPRGPSKATKALTATEAGKSIVP
jgi:hypothetical protein